MAKATKNTPLQDYMILNQFSQAAIGELFGLSQTAISKMLRSGRKVFVVEEPDGTLHIKEDRTIATAANPSMAA